MSKRQKSARLLDRKGSEKRAREPRRLLELTHPMSPLQFCEPQLIVIETTIRCVTLCYVSSIRGYGPAKFLCVVCSG